MRSALLLLALCSSIAHAAGVSGTWALQFGERNLFVLRIQPDGTGTLDRPATMTGSNYTFANMKGRRTDRITRHRFEGEALYFTTQNANDPTDSDDFILRAHQDTAELSLDMPDLVLGPLSFHRVAASATVATDWEPNRIYVPGDSDVSNEELNAIYTEDQKMRGAGLPTPGETWANIAKKDAAHRERLHQLLAAGALHTSRDYEQAAVIFQHGSNPDDYLLAHVLAMVAMSKGNSTAINIAAMTLDRYLTSIRQKQILGTQYWAGKDRVWTQEPYDRDLISDALRTQLGIASQASQAEQLKLMQQQEKKP